VAWRVNGEGVLMLGGPRALLMQIAHPAVAAGVADHSDFPADPYTRLWRTLDAMLAISFGDTQQCKAAAARVAAVHRRVRGATAGGRPYRATDPPLLKWVHATLADSGLAVYGRFFGPLSPAEMERYVLEMNRLALLMGIPESVVAKDLASFTGYVEETVESLDVSEAARDLAPWILRPPLPLALRPAGRFQELVTVGLLPEALRRRYGLRWTGGHERLLNASAAVARAVVPHLPALVRRWPQARAAERRVLGRRPARPLGLQAGS
jgi:uncharacterized protein (DUF2236 family)